MTPRFLYEMSPWGQSVEERKQWFEGLEQFGPDTVRVRLAQTRGTSDDSHLILTKHLTPIRGFAEDWLKWKDEQRDDAVAAREERMIRRGGRLTGLPSQRPPRLSQPSSRLEQPCSSVDSGFRKAFAKRRCLVPVDGFYEGKSGQGEAAPAYRHG